MRMHHATAESTDQLRQSLWRWTQIMLQLTSVYLKSILSLRKEGSYLALIAEVHCPEHLTICLLIIDKVFLSLIRSPQRDLFSKRKHWLKIKQKCKWLKLAPLLRAVPVVVPGTQWTCKYSGWWNEWMNREEKFIGQALRNKSVRIAVVGVGSFRTLGNWWSGLMLMIVEMD